MRHSSWTLFLVPLALALVVVLLPGTTTSSDLSDPTGRAGYGQLLEEDFSRMENTLASSGSADEVAEAESEALYKD